LKRILEDPFLWLMGLLLYFTRPINQSFSPACTATLAENEESINLEMLSSLVFFYEWAIVPG
jgi:hypothetical protein